MVKKIKEAKGDVERYQKRVKCTSVLLMLIGLVGVLVSLHWQIWGAKHHSMMMVNFPPPHHRGHHGKGGKHHRPPPPPRPEELERLAPKYVSREELDLYEAFKTLSTITFFLFAKIAAIGKCGKWMVWGNKSEVTHTLHKKSCFGLALVVIVALVAMREAGHIHHIMERVHEKHEAEGRHHGPPRPPMEEGEHPGRHHHGGRFLAEWPGEEAVEEVELEQPQFAEFETQAPMAEEVEEFPEPEMDGFLGRDGHGKRHGGRHHRGGEEHHGKRGGCHGGKEGWEQGRHGKHGKHGRPHHGASSCCFLSLGMIALFGAHFLFVKGLKHHQEMYEILTGKKEAKKECKKPTQTAVSVVPQQVVVVNQPAAVNYSVVDSTISDHSDAMMLHTEPPATTLDFNRHQMV